MEKVANLLNILQSNFDECDFKWTLFVAAANHYKFDSLLKPFPPAFVDGKTLDIFRLRKVIESVPVFSILVEKLQFIVDNKSFDENVLSENSIDLLHWCLITVREPSLKIVERQNVSKFFFFFQIGNCVLFITMICISIRIHCK